MIFNIKKKTESKCETCSYSIRLKDGEGRIAANYCTAGYEGKIAVPLVVTECNRYDFKYDDVPHHMKEKGWVMEMSKSRQFIGFRQPKQKKVDDE